MSVVLFALLFSAPPQTPPPEWRWRPILSAPRIGGQLRAVTVDPADPRVLYVGTEEGTVLRTNDGGVSWEELGLQATVIYANSHGLHVPGLPELGEVYPNNFYTSVDPPSSSLGDRIVLDSVAEPFEIRPDFFYAQFLVRDPSLEERLFDDATNSRIDETLPVRRISLCRGARYPLLVATYSDVFGSDDDGTTFVRLFANPGRLAINTFTCSPTDPNVLAVGTEVGLFVSKDGGLSFAQDLEAWPGQSATAVGFGPTADRTRMRLYSAAGSELYGGDFDKRGGLEYLYPSDDASTAPWMDIGSIATTTDGEVWLGTDDGVRVSMDFGQTFQNVAPDLLGRQQVAQVAVGQNEAGKKRVAVMINAVPLSTEGVEVAGLQDTVVYVTEDSGRTWQPFFFGLSRRRLRQITTLPAKEGRPLGWWILTSGELWTSYPADPVAKIDADAQRWADERLKKTPPLAHVLGSALAHLRLDPEQIYDLAASHRALNWIPRLDLSLVASDRLYGRAESQRTSTFGTAAIDEAIDRRQVAVFLQAYWELNDTQLFTEEVGGIRDCLHELRNQMAYATEDAWDERRTLLVRLASGMGDPMEIESLKSRIDALEASLTVWLGRPIEEL